ncbi:MAG TPA: hypothetical protein PKD00_00530 [Burkholderiales bacterium]|nr:hypothetical protein [Burkholderiales bacterium]
MTAEHLKNIIVEGFKFYGDKLIVHSNKSWSGKMIADEIEKETEYGLETIKDVVMLTIDLVMRSKKTLTNNTTPPAFIPTEYTGQKLDYGKYLVVRKDGKVHFETYNGTGWAYNHKVITHFYLPKIK